MSPLAGKRLPAASLVDVPGLVTAYYAGRPDAGVAEQRVAFGTSGHRGSALTLSFNEAHILAITQAICWYRAGQGITGPLFLGIDTHALSAPARASALEVLAGNDVAVVLDETDGFTPTPVISREILLHNRGRTEGRADGIVITPSHNPPQDGGFKYDPPEGGPASSEATGWIQEKANGLLAEGRAGGLAGVRRVPLARALAGVRRRDFVGGYVEDLASVVDMEAIKAAGVRIGVDPLGGASVGYWPRIIERYGLAGEVVNDAVDPTFRFMAADWDGQIRMDCSSPYAMAPLIALRDRFDVAVANDTDADRHGIVCPSSGLMNPNHYLTACIDYLFANRPDWPGAAGVGKTIVSSSSIDRAAQAAGRRLFEVPVGFKYFVDGLLGGTMGFAGEESAGASFLRRDGTVWTTDKDGPILCLLAAEMTARTGRDPGERYRAFAGTHGEPAYARIDAPADARQKAALKGITAEQVPMRTLAGEAVVAKTTTAPGNGEAFGGIKVMTESGWFAARPSGTEEVYKLYAESFRGAEALGRIQEEAKAALAGVLAA